MEEDLWRQKVAVRWLKGGDRNTMFYQSWVNQKRARLRIHSVQVGDRVLTEESEVKGSAAMFFQDLLAPPTPPLAEPNLSLIQQMPNTTDWSGLTSLPSAEEVKQAVWEILGDSAPGPDGFTATFYHKCWDVIGHDVVDAVLQFFAGAYLPMIVLLPKTLNPTLWSEYRPISLCNVSNKIITKILTSRLTPFLPKVISPNQSGFVKGRLLNDNVLLAQEMFHELYRSKPAPNLAIKLDMAKA